MSWTEQDRIVAGVMSGTSLDGIDVAIVRVGSADDVEVPTWELLSTSMIPYTTSMHERLLMAVAGDMSMRQAYRLDVDLGGVTAEAIERGIEDAGLEAGAIDAIGLHGQTVWHAPEIRPIGATVQIGSAAVVAGRTRIPVVYDFRMDDIVAGGEGAPFVPLFDGLYLRSADVDRVLLNIGGIANLTWLPKGSGADLENLLAFDTGPGNALIDGAMRHFYDRTMDENASVASSGSVDEILLARLSEDPWFEHAPPKSTGRERFGDETVRQICDVAIEAGISQADIIATLTELTAMTVADAISRFCSADPTYELVVAGGGVHNPLMLESLQRRTGVDRLKKSEDLGVPSDAKEAICFAILAWLRLAGRPGNVPSVTGASRGVVCGSVRMP